MDRATVGLGCVGWMHGGNGVRWICLNFYGAWSTLCGGGGYPSQGYLIHLAYPMDIPWDNSSKLLDDHVRYGHQRFFQKFSICIPK